MFERFANHQTDWMARVNAACGIEMLYGQGWRLLAASPSVWAENGDRPEDHLGNTLWDYPFLRPSKAALEGMGLFEGNVRCLKLSLEIYFGERSLIRDLEFWPVILEDSALLVHLTGVNRDVEPGLKRSKRGFRLLDARAIPVAMSHDEAM